MDTQLSLMDYRSGVWRGVTPRDWQRAALPAILASVDRSERGVVSAVMGSGKSVLISEVLLQRPAPAGCVNVVSTPTQRLTEQLHATFASRGLDAGMYYASAKDVRPVTVVCQASLPQLSAELQESGTRVHLWIADEAHRTEADTILASVGLLQPAAAVGFTATPFRSSKTESISAFDRVLHEYTAADAFRDRVIVKPELVLYEGQEAPLDDVCVRMVQAYVGEGPGLVNARSITDAEAFALLLRKHNVAAKAVHSGLGSAEVAVRIEELRKGELDALVHVDMLTEGVDLPWLRWLCMRRQVGSAVRFCQEVGRVLRAAPGKDRAFLLDPNDLFDAFGLTYEAVVGMQVSKRERGKTELEQLADELCELLRMPVENEDRIARSRVVARAMSEARRYVRRMYLAFVAAGVIEQKVKSTAWRKNPPSDKQTAALVLYLGQFNRDTRIPLAHRKAFGIIAADVSSLRRGDVSDMLGIVFALRDLKRAKKPWPLESAT